jgi:hypothetical protein
MPELEQLQGSDKEREELRRADRKEALDRVLDGLAQLELLGYRFRLIEETCR